ncbi:hypothetical protein D6D29_04652 [Aureobasidium pullulans]|nr:hypothetical protein D6D29_04652 [Aureobasidium pullulans]
MTCRISRFTTYQGIAFQKRTTHTTTHAASRGQSRSLSFFPQPSQQKKKKMPPSTKHLLEKFLSLFSCSRLGDDEDDDDEATSRPLVIGGPVDFRHHETEGGGPLRAPVSGAPEPFVR